MVSESVQRVTVDQGTLDLVRAQHTHAAAREAAVEVVGVRVDLDQLSV